MKAVLEISKEWATGAFAVARNQGSLPNSPAEADGDQIRLCAAACIASEGFRRRSEAQQMDFINRLKMGGDKHVVVEAFVQLGLSAEACLETMRINDEASKGRRIGSFRELLKL
jgi:hypothetical protein